MNTCDYLLFTGCAQKKCSSFFGVHEHGDSEEDITNGGIRDFKDLDVEDHAEVRFFTHPAWKNIQECDARNRAPAKVAPCES